MATHLPKDGLQSLAFYIWLKCDSCHVVSYQQPLHFCKNGLEREPFTPAIGLCRSKECLRCRHFLRLKRLLTRIAVQIPEEFLIK